MSPPAPNDFNEWSKRVLINYIREIADKMGLRDWQFNMEKLPDDHTSIMRTKVWGDSKTATVWVGKSFWLHGPRMQREIVVHELTHWHTDLFNSEALRIVQNALGKEAMGIATGVIDTAHELLVDGISAAWARMFPLINWSDERPIYSEYEDNKETWTIDEINRLSVE